MTNYSPLHLRRIHSNPDYTIDQYGTLAWASKFIDKEIPRAIQNDLISQGVHGGVKIQKSKSELPSKPENWFGKVPEKLHVQEYGVTYEIRTTAAHPGLFLDHQFTRLWLKENSKDKSALNLFSYTGSLGISAAMGGARESMNIDLSNPSTEWAKENAKLNQLSDQHLFIKGDVFDWVKRFQKKSRKFDIVISDPPSQSRSDELHFSTEKHLDMLHESCIQLIAPKGVLITSINTEKMDQDVLLASVYNLSKKLHRKIKSHEFLELPEGFSPKFRSMRGIRVYFS